MLLRDVTVLTSLAQCPLWCEPAGEWLPPALPLSLNTAPFSTALMNSWSCSVDSGHSSGLVLADSTDIITRCTHRNSWKTMTWTRIILFVRISRLVRARSSADVIQFKGRCHGFCLFIFQSWSEASAINERSNRHVSLCLVNCHGSTREWRSPVRGIYSVFRVWAHVQSRSLGESTFYHRSFLHRCSHASQARHERVCTQQVSKKRPVFNTSKKRIEGTEMQAFFASRPYLKTKKPSTAEMVGFWDLYDALTFHQAYFNIYMYI